MKRERDPTPEEFEKLLAWFDPDSEEAGAKFNLIQSRLIRVFVSHGCVDAESLADEVINRVAVRIETVVEKYPDPIRCSLGFVEKVYHEYRRDLLNMSNAIEPPRPRPWEELEREDQCLKQCLENLTKPERDLFESYFQGEKRARINARKKLALELTLTANALRIRAFHLRKELHQCIVTCLSQI